MLPVITFADQELNTKLDMETLDSDKLKFLNDVAETIMKNINTTSSYFNIIILFII